jgi:hypothetical protein
MISNIQYNAAGYPIMGYISGSPFVMSGSAYGSPAAAPAESAGAVTPSILENFPGMYPWVMWGPGNNYPLLAIADFRKNGVASRGLKLKTDMLYGKNVVPVRVTGYDDDAQKEIVEVVLDDQEINEFLRRSNIDIFRGRCITDFVYWGMFFPIFLLNEDRSAISMVAHDKAAKFRFAPMDVNLGRIDSVFRSANWPFPYISGFEEIKAIDAVMAYLEVDRVRYDKEFRYVFPVVSYDVLNDYYPVTIHESLRLNGTLQNANDIPAMVAAIIKNGKTIQYHIRIPISYWIGLYPDWDRKKQPEKDAIVNAKLNEIDQFLSGKDNQMKAFISHYAVDPVTGKEIAGWEIIPLDNKMKYDAWNNVDTATTAQILFSIGINPAIFGLGVPGGANTGGGNNGGSSIREAWLTMIASSSGDRNILYSWWPFVRDYNGYDPTIQLRTVDQVLTTLDQGKGTEKQLS